MLDHRRDRGGLARAGGPHKQDQSAPLECQALERVRKHQIVEARHALRDVANHGRHGAALLKGAEPETAQAGHRHADVQLARPPQFGELLGGDPLRQQLDDVIGPEPLLVDRNAYAVELDCHWRADRQIEVGGILLGHQAEKAVEIHRSVSLRASSIRKPFGADESRKWPKSAAASGYSRSSSLMLVLARVRASTCLTMTAQYRLQPAEGSEPATTTEPDGTRP